MEEAIADIHLKETILVLAIAGVIVPFLLYRWRVNPILGYLGVGLVLGPSGLGYLAKDIHWLSMFTFDNAEVADIAGVAEFGIVFLLFLIGTELSIKRLATMRWLVFGVGGAQVVISSCVLAVALSVAGFDPTTSIIVGSSFALSSSAIVIEILSRAKRLASVTGRLTISVLLFQDLAVIPILLLLNTLSSTGDQTVLLGLFVSLGEAVLVVICIFAVGRLILTPLFRVVTSTASQELFMAATLLVIIVASVTTAFAGLSMALGAFTAGLLLAETEYRRAVEAMIDPFKGLLLGVFFFSVGMQVDLAMFFSNPALILLLTCVLNLIKGLITFGVTRFAGVSVSSAIETTLLIAPGGEFAFIIVGMASSLGLLSGEVADLSMTVVSVSMLLLPLNAAFGRWLVKSMKTLQPAAGNTFNIPPEETRYSAIVVGFGRVGEMVANLLEAHHFSYCVADSNATKVTLARDKGYPVYYGNAFDCALLKCLGLTDASVIIITTSDAKVTSQIVEAVRDVRPDVPVIARARDAGHARRLYELGVTDAVFESIEASLQLSELALMHLEVPMGTVMHATNEKRAELQSILSQVRKVRGLT